jgi:dolichol-phosphate mannosyltransferase
VDRQDSGSKRWASRWANAIRARALRDATPDTGCGIKLFERAAFLDLPYFDHMHRYLPALMQRAGWRTVSVPVHHRHRTSGVSKYNNLQRAWVGLRDLRGVAWLIRRTRRTEVEEVRP